MIRIATWNTSPGRYLFSQIDDAVAGVPISIAVADHRTCLKWLESDVVDIALLPVLSVLQNIDDLELLPEVCLASSESYPYATLEGVDDLSSLSKIQFDPLYAQEVLMQKIVSHEAYGLTPEFEAVQFEKDLDFDAPRLIVNKPEVYSERSMDLGREWFECSAYPAIWGLLAIRVGSFQLADLQPLILALSKVNAEQIRNDWADKAVETGQEKEFFRTSIRTRIDMEVQAGLDATLSYFFAHGITDDLPLYPFLKKEETEK